MTDENEYGIFEEMPLEEIFQFFLGEGFWMRLNIQDRGPQNRWLVKIKIARPRGMKRSEYYEIPNVSAFVHDDLMRAAREAACSAYYGEPEIDLGIKGEE